MAVRLIQSIKVKTGKAEMLEVRLPNGVSWMNKMKVKSAFKKADFIAHKARLSLTLDQLKIHFSAKDNITAVPLVLVDYIGDLLSSEDNDAHFGRGIYKFALKDSSDLTRLLRDTFFWLGAVGGVILGGNYGAEHWRSFGDPVPGSLLGGLLGSVPGTLAGVLIFETGRAILNNVIMITRLPSLLKFENRYDFKIDYASFAKNEQLFAHDIAKLIAFDLDQPRTEIIGEEKERLENDCREVADIINSHPEEKREAILKALISIKPRLAEGLAKLVPIGQVESR